MKHDGEIVVRMHIDEAGRDGKAATIDTAPRGRRHSSDHRNPIAFERNVTCAGRGVCAVVDRNLSDHHIMHLRSPTC
jgi:hypothetical protein